MLKHILELLEAGQESYENMNSYRNQYPGEQVQVLYDDSHHDLVWILTGLENLLAYCPTHLVTKMLISASQSLDQKIDFHLQVFQRKM